MSYSIDELNEILKDRKKYFELRNKLLKSYEDFLDYIKVKHKDGYLESAKDYFNNLTIKNN